MSLWHPLETELARWRAEGRDLPIWWRDDDAVAPTAALEHLLTLAERLACPVHLAVIPAGATTALADLCQSQLLAPCLVHGWAHHNHAPATAKKAEFGAHRPLSDLTQEAANGLERLRGLFGAALLPVFVPPWNRIAPEMVAALPGLGYHALSTFTPRAQMQAAPGLWQINTHLDPIDWRGTCSAVAPDKIIAQVTQDLTDRREGRADANEPYGILTHHLVHDPAIWRVTETLLARLLDSGARPVHLGETLTQGDPT